MSLISQGEIDIVTDYIDSLGGNFDMIWFLPFDNKKICHSGYRHTSYSKSSATPYDLGISFTGILAGRSYTYSYNSIHGLR